MLKKSGSFKPQWKQDPRVRLISAYFTCVMYRRVFHTIKQEGKHTEVLLEWSSHSDQQHNKLCWCSETIVCSQQDLLCGVYALKEHSKISLGAWSCQHIWAFSLYLPPLLWPSHLSWMTNTAAGTRQACHRDQAGKTINSDYMDSSAEVSNVCFIS